MAERAIKNKSAKEARVRKPVDLPETPKSLSGKAVLFMSKLTTRRMINAIATLLSKSRLFLLRKDELEKRSPVATTRTKVNILGALTGS
jgi:hypothetical protein